jgi:protein-tyrosine phosphatase
MAQGVMEKCIESHQLDWYVDSAGTNGYHNGEHPDPRAIREAKKHQIDISKQISRQIKHADLDLFDIILAMDSNNLSYLKSMCKNSEQSSKIRLLMDFAFPGKNKAVPDPYYDNSFDHAIQLISVACNSMIDVYKNSKDLL